MSNLWQALLSIWETTSGYYVITFLLSLFAVALSLYYEVFLESKEAADNYVVKEEFDALLKRQPQLLAKKIEDSLSEEQRETERRVQTQQLSAIYELLQKQSGTFGDTSIDDLQEQLKLYR